MLVELHVENFLIIERLSLVFEKGLTVFTGESGAGKSIILDCIDIITGSKIKGDIIRQNQEKAVVVAIFDISEKENIKLILEESGFSYENNLLIVKKIITKTGSRIFINEQNTTVDFVSRITKNLIEIYSQFEQMDLLNDLNHINMLDEFINSKKELIDLKEKFQIFNKLRKDFLIKEEEIIKSKNEIEYLKIILDDLEKLSFKEDEYNKLIEQKNLSSNSHYISSKAKIIQNNLYELSNNKKIQEIIKFCDFIIEKIPQENHSYRSLKEITTLISNAEIQIKEALYEFDDISNSLIFENINLDEIEDRISDIKSFARKYRIEIENIENFQRETENKLNNISNEEYILKNLQDTLNKEQDECLKIAKIISDKRKETAILFEKKIKEKLNSLGLYAEFEVLFEEKDLSETGIDKVVFLASLNPGMKKNAINQIASGGELSRFMLCLKSILSEYIHLETMIFDEIDTGVSGNIAHKIAREMLNLSKNTQVISITHNPQVAAFGKYHMLITKNIENNEAKTTVRKLNHQERIDAIGYMLSGGQITNEARKNAEILMSGIYENNSF